jgi:FkbM family methyltransferase
MDVTRDDYLPAAGKHWLLPLYDPFLALFTRERRWRGQILEALDLRPDDRVVDVGCGTGTLAILAKERVPGAEIVGIDPDPRALARARKKAARKGLAVTFQLGFGDEMAKIVGENWATKAVSSLALHHMKRAAQLATIAAMYAALRPGGAVRIADFVGGGHFNGYAEGGLIADLTAQGFENARSFGRFRAAFADAEIVGAEKPVR